MSYLFKKGGIVSIRGGGGGLLSVPCKVWLSGTNLKVPVLGSAVFLWV